jgi:hypothetical protein
MKLKLDRKQKRELKRLLSAMQDKTEYVDASLRSVEAGPEEGVIDIVSQLDVSTDQHGKKVVQVIQEGWHRKHQGEETIRQAFAKEEARRGDDEGAPEARPTGVRLPEGQVGRQGHSQGSFCGGNQEKSATLTCMTCTTGLASPTRAEADHEEQRPELLQEGKPRRSGTTSRQHQRWQKMGYGRIRGRDMDRALPLSRSQVDEEGTSGEDSHLRLQQEGERLRDALLAQEACVRLEQVREEEEQGVQAPSLERPSAREEALCEERHTLHRSPPVPQDKVCEKVRPRA